MAINSVALSFGSAVTIETTRSDLWKTISPVIQGAVSGRWYTFVLLAKGSNTVIGATQKIQAVNSTPGVSWLISDTNFLTKLDGATRSGTTGLKALYYVRCAEFIGDPDSGGTPQGSTVNSPDGVATISLRYSAIGAVAYDLDVGGDLIANWTRPSSTHSGFRARCKVYVNGAYQFVRSGYTASYTRMAYPPNATELGDMKWDMGGVSPRSWQARVETGWNFSAGVVYDDVTYYSDTANIIMSVIGHVWVKVSGVMQKCEAFIKAPTFTRQKVYVRDAGVWKESK